MKQEIVMTIGLPASGKTTWTEEHIKRNPEYVNVNRDDLRLMLQGRERYGKFSKWREETVTIGMMAIAQEALSQGKSVIVSDTNLDPQRNLNWKGLAEDRGIVYREELFTHVPHGVCIDRDAKREHPVGQRVIMGMFDRYRDHWWPKPVYNDQLPDAYVFDIDGTLALMHNRSPFEWHKVGNDLPNEDIIEIAHALKGMHSHIIILSGRDGVCRPETEEWLAVNGVGYHYFYMRDAGDQRKDYVIKEELYRQHIEGKFNVRGVFDDRDQVVHLWRHLGLTTMQVNYGNF